MFGTAGFLLAPGGAFLWLAGPRVLRLPSGRTFDAERRVAGDYAIERARYEARITPKDGGTGTEESGKHIVVYRRQADGTWKVLWEIWNSDGGA